MQNFRRLKVWRSARPLTLGVYEATAQFPREERYALTSQLRRAATSIPANIAEGCGRGTRPELARFLRVAWASANELDCHLELARDLRFLDASAHAQLTTQLVEVRKMLTSLIQILRVSTR